MRKLLSGEPQAGDATLGRAIRAQAIPQPGLPWLRKQIRKDLAKIRENQQLDTAQISLEASIESGDVLDTASETNYALFAKAHHPREPEEARTSKANTARKLGNFQAYKSTRPDLLESLNRMVESGLKTISSSKPPASNPPNPGALQEHDEEKLFLIYSAAFQVYVNESTLYQRFLADVKSAYDGYVTVLVDELNQHVARSAQTAQRERNLEAQHKEFEAEKQRQMISITAQLRDMESLYAQLQQEKNKIKMDLSALAQTHATTRKEYEDLKSTCAMLTSSLARMEEDHRNFQAKEGLRNMEMASLRANEQKLNEEIGRLQLALQNNETAMGMMVHQDTVQQLENTITLLKDEQKRMEGTHQQLLMRYAALKSAVDTCFAHYEPASQSADPLHSCNQLASQSQKAADMVKEILQASGGSGGGGGGSSPAKAGVGSKEDGAVDSVHRLMRLVEQGMSAKLIVEALLDQVTRGHPRDRSSTLSGPYSDLARDAATGHGHSPDKSVMTSHTFTTDNEEGMTFSEEFISPWTHFDGQGYDDSVPSYLRFNGKIQNLFLSRKDTVAILTELWDAKSTFDTQLAISMDSNVAAASKLTDMILDSSSPTHGGLGYGEDRSPGGYSPPRSSGPMPGSGDGSRRKRLSTTSARASGIGGLVSQSLMEIMPLNPKFSTFIEYYLKDKFNSNLLATEMYYNILDAVKRFSSLSDCKIFTTMFEEKLPFEIKDELQNMLELLYDEAVKEAKISAGQVDIPSSLTRSPAHAASGAANVLSMESFIRLLRRLFPFKPDQSFGKLNKALVLDSQTMAGGGASGSTGRTTLNIDALLYEDHSGSRSNFLEQLRLQFLAEAIQFEKHVLDSLDQLAEGSDKDITVGKCREAIVRADPNKPRSEVNQWLSRGCMASIEEMLLLEARRGTVCLADFKRNLCSVLLKRSPPATRK